jgi:hypothetical protein
VAILGARRDAGAPYPRKGGKSASRPKCSCRTQSRALVTDHAFPSLTRPGAAASRLKEQCRERPGCSVIEGAPTRAASCRCSSLCDSELEGRWRHRSSISKRKRPSASPAADRRLLRDEMQQTAGRAHYRLPRGERACHVGLRVPESLPPSEQRNGHPPAVHGYGVAPHDVARRPQRLEHHQLIPELPPTGSGEGSRRAD